SLYQSVPPPALHSFPTRRSSDLRISDQDQVDVSANPPPVGHDLRHAAKQLEREGFLLHVHPIDRGRDRCGDQPEDIGARTNLPEDRKSTRLNSSHVAISYAVFCL